MPVHPPQSQHDDSLLPKGVRPSTNDGPADLEGEVRSVDADEQRHDAHREKMRARSRLEGATADLGTQEARQRALQDAFEYRGDVAILRADQSVVVGYVFDRRPSGPADVPIEAVRLYVEGSSTPVTIDAASITGLKFSGRDFATGAVWEARMDALLRKQRGPDAGPKSTGE